MATLEEFFAGLEVEKADKEQHKRKKKYEDNKRWREANLEKARESVRKCRASNPEKERERKKKYYTKNRNKILLRQKVYENTDARKQRKRERKREYVHGITPIQFNDMLAVQCGVCALCGINKPGGQGTFKVDHCHSTGVIRGLLCHHCNVGLGHFKDNSELLRKAADYLDQFKAPTELQPTNHLTTSH